MPLDPDCAASETTTADLANGRRILATDAAAVARYRAALDWMLTVPEWEGPFALAISQLGYKGKRQGINFRNAALALPLEAKSHVVRHALKEDLARPQRPEAIRLLRHWGDTAHRPDPASARLGSYAWTNARRRLALRISSRHLDYKASQQRLYAAYAHVAADEARQHCRLPSRRDDALQEGRLALLQAIDKIEPDGSFEAYARQWIRRRIRNFVMQQLAPVSTPINLVSRSLSAASRSCDPADPRLIEIARWIRTGARPLDVLDSSDPTTLGDSDLPALPCDNADQSDRIRALTEAVNSLTPKQKEVIALRFGVGEAAPTARSLAEVAAATGISRQQVHQRERRALAKLADELAYLASEL